MTGPTMADATYIEPIKWADRCQDHRERASGRAAADHGRPDLLNCAWIWTRRRPGKFGVEMIGANADTIDKAEDRSRFDKAMKSIGQRARVPVSPTAWKRPTRSSKDRLPCIIRPSFTMGGTGGGIHLQP